MSIETLKHIIIDMIPNTCAAIIAAGITVLGIGTVVEKTEPMPEWVETPHKVSEQVRHILTETETTLTEIRQNNRDIMRGTYRQPAPQQYGAQQKDTGLLLISFPDTGWRSEFQTILNKKKTY